MAVRLWAEGSDRPIPTPREGALWAIARRNSQGIPRPISPLSLRETDSRILHPVSNVGQEIGEPENRDNNHTASLNQGQVPVLNSIDEQTPDPRIAKHRFDDDQTAKQPSDEYRDEKSNSILWNIAPQCGRPSIKRFCESATFSSCAFVTYQATNAIGRLPMSAGTWGTPAGFPS